MRVLFYEVETSEEDYLRRTAFFAALRGAAFFAALRGAAFLTVRLAAVFFAALRGAAFFTVFFAVAFFAALRGAAFLTTFLRAVFFATATMPPVWSDPCDLQGTCNTTVTERTQKYKDIRVICHRRVAYMIRGNDTWMCARIDVLAILVS